VDIQQRADLLAGTELFQVVDAPSLELLARRVTERVVAKGELVFRQDDPGAEMFVLASGAVKLYISPDPRSRHRIELVRHRPPAMFGELALLDGGPRSASAEAIERSLMVAVGRDVLIPLIRSQPGLAEALLRSLGKIVRRTTDQVSELVFLDLQGRLARKLLELIDPDFGPTKRTRRITQGELATMVSGARQTVNQALRALESRHLIRARNGHVELLRPDKLVSLAELRRL
jgi:CRP/FNR family cyclic AMP-dependent transcriptional regulator